MNWPLANRIKVIGICAGLAALVFIVFGQTVRYDFVNYDDQAYVYRNNNVTKSLTPGGVAQAFTRKEMGLWDPLATISHMLDCRLYGLKPGGHHLTNVMLHLASVILLFLILLEMTGAPWRSAFVAAVFAVHPLNVESVAWISERKDVLSGLFFMLTLGAYLQYIRRPGSPSRYLAVVFLFAMGLTCKPMLVTLPFVLLLLDYWPLKRLFLPSLNRRAITEKIPLLALSFALCVATLMGPKETSFIPQVPFWTRMSEAPAWVVSYMGQMIWPTGLSVIYTHPEESLAWLPSVLALCGLLTVGIFLSRRKHPYLWMGWLWNLGMLAPVSGIVQISRHARADHYNYLPQIGLYIGLTWAAADWAEEWRHRRFVLAGFAAAMLCCLLVAARNQTSYWRDSTTLWTHALGCTRDNSVGHTELGEALFEQGQMEEAIAHYREALRIDPFNAEANNNLANALLQQGRMEEAISFFRAALQINPGYADAHYNLGIALCRQGRTEEGIAEFRAALEIDPSLAKAHYNLGIALLEQRQIDEAIAHYSEALRINPAYAEAHDNLGIALVRQGRTEEAIAHIQRALELQPANPAFQNNLAWTLATASPPSLRDSARAVELATQASLSSGGGNPLFLRTLAVAYAEAGEFANAAQTAHSALPLAEARSNAALASQLRREIKLYETGRRFEDAPP